MRPLDLSSEQLSDAEAIFAAKPSTITRITNTLVAHKKPVIKPSQLVAIASQAINNPELAKSAIRLALQFATYARHWQSSPDDLISLLQSSLAKDEKWPREKSDYFQQQILELRALLENEKIVAAAKALDLAFDHERVVENIRILTDIRPVFDPSKTGIIGAVVTQTLRIEFFDRHRFTSVSLALDEDDIRSLEKTCKEALSKAQSSRKLLSAVGSLDVFAAGEEGYVVNN